jgi:plastocyanin
LLAVLLVAAIIAGAAAAPAGAALKTKQVTIKNYAFAPQTITVNAGTRVTWKNADGFDHHLASANSLKTTAKVTGMFSSGVLRKGSTFSFTYKKKGTYYYECTIHASMTSMHGKVVVK